MFWDNKTVTLFNRFYDGTKECWYPTLLNFFEYMRKQYDNIFKVASVARYEDVLPHFEVGGK